MRTNQVKDFSVIPSVEIPRSVFSRSCGHKTTLDAGYLVPFFCDEVLPGDTFSVRGAFFARLLTPIVPVMDNVFVDTHFFFVPNRLVWDNWQRFCGEQTAPGDSTDYLVPVIEAPTGGYPVSSIYDYMGMPPNVDNIEMCAFYARAYNLIYNEWYRDQNLQDPVPVHKGDGPDPWDDYPLLKRNKRHDYFTSCLPWPQKGPGVELSLGATAPVIAAGDGIPTWSVDGGVRSLYSHAGARTVDWSDNIGNTVAAHWLDPKLEVNLAATTAVTINSLRTAFQIQKLLERDARGGTRYVEILRSHFSVISPDARLQRPEYLGGSTSQINFSSVAQTSSTDAVSPQGNLAAFSTGSDRYHGFNKSFTEHGVIIGLVSVRADLTYQQGIPRMFSRQTRWDYYWPALAHLGEQAVLNKEIYADGTAADEEVFGYNERWAEYRYKPSQISGMMRSSSLESLDLWHLAQDFATRPHLNSSFIQENPPLDRVLAVTNQPHFKFDFWLDCRCARCMPLHSVPGLTDHF